MKIDEVYARQQENKKQLREQKKAINDALAQDERYKEIVEQMKALRVEKKAIEENIITPKEREDMEDLKSEISADKELLSDIALNQYIANEVVEVVDEYDQKHVPRFSVKFIKA